MSAYQRTIFKDNADDAETENKAPPSGLSLVEAYNRVRAE